MALQIWQQDHQTQLKSLYLAHKLKIFAIQNFSNYFSQSENDYKFN